MSVGFGFKFTSSSPMPLDKSNQTVLCTHTLTNMHKCMHTHRFCGWGSAGKPGHVGVVGGGDERKVIWVSSLQREKEREKEAGGETEARRIPSSPWTCGNTPLIWQRNCNSLLTWNKTNIKMISTFRSASSQWVKLSLTWPNVYIYIQIRKYIFTFVGSAVYIPIPK